jgi:hypothetical protein
MFVFLYRNQPEKIYSFTFILMMRKPLLSMMSLDKMVVYYGDFSFGQLIQNYIDNDNKEHTALWAYRSI